MIGFRVVYWSFIAILSFVNPLLGICILLPFVGIDAFIGSLK